MHGAGHTGTTALSPVACGSARSPERAETYYVAFEYHFDARRPENRSCGTGEAELTLKLRGNDIIITGEGGRVLRRGC